MFTFKLAQQYSALQEEECLYVQPIHTPLGYCRHVTLDVFWLKGEKAFRNVETLFSLTPFWFCPRIIVAETCRLPGFLNASFDGQHVPLVTKLHSY